MHKVETFKWVVATICAAPAVFLIVMNWVIFRHNLRSHRENIDSFSSWVPLLGGLLGAVALWIAPTSATKPFWWVPFVMDYGCVIGLTGTAIHWSKYKKQNPGS